VEFRDLLLQFFVGKGLEVGDLEGAVLFQDVHALGAVTVGGENFKGHKLLRD